MKEVKEIYFERIEGQVNRLYTELEGIGCFQHLNEGDKPIVFRLLKNLALDSVKHAGDMVNELATGLRNIELNNPNP